MKTLFTFALCLLCAAAHAGNQVTATVTVTNATFNGYTFTVNGNTLTWTNNVLSPSTQIATNADVTGCGSKTNLLNQMALNPITLVSPPLDLGSNIFSLRAVSTNPLVVTVSGTYATIVYSTQTVSSAIAVRVPVSIETLAVQTNIDSSLVAAINSAPNTNSLDQNAAVAGQLLGTNKTQTVFGVMTVNNVSSVWNGFISQVNALANVLRGGYWSNAFLDNPISTNLVNYGNAISSPGSGSQSEQFGVAAVSSGLGSLAIGPGALASGDFSTAVGDAALATNVASFSAGQNAHAYGAASTAIGVNAAATNSLASAYGEASAASGSGSSAFGALAKATFDNSTAIGKGAQTTATNQVMLGGPGSSTVVTNTLSVGASASIGTTLTVGADASIAGNFAILGVQTNGAHVGTNNFLANSDIAFAKLSISSLAIGGNAGVAVGTNVFAEVSGPTGAFSINGINASGAQRDGKQIIIKNSTGQTMTIANASGTDPTAGNRILTGTGADVSVTSNPGMATLIYSASDSRWILMSHN